MGVYPAASDPTETAHVLFQAEAVQTNTEVLSVIAATLANVGVCPLTQERCLSPDVLKVGGLLACTAREGPLLSPAMHTPWSSPACLACSACSRRCR